MINKIVIVVEGLHDESRIKMLNKNYLTVSVGGLMIRPEKIELIKQLSKNCEIILFFDADFPGTKIRNIVSKEIPNAKHAYLSYQKSKGPRNKVGVEHASLEDINYAINKAVSYENSLNHNKNIKTLKNIKQIDYKMLHNLGLINDINSKKRRDILTNKLNIGYSNGKQLLNKLNALSISYERIVEILDESSI